MMLPMNGVFSTASMAPARASLSWGMHDSVCAELHSMGFKESVADPRLGPPGPLLEPWCCLSCW